MSQPRAQSVLSVDANQSLVVLGQDAEILFLGCFFILLSIALVVYAINSLFYGNKPSSSDEALEPILSQTQVAQTTPVVENVGVADPVTLGFFEWRVIVWGLLGRIIVVVLGWEIVGRLLLLTDVLLSSLVGVVKERVSVMSGVNPYHTLILAIPFGVFFLYLWIRWILGAPFGRFKLALATDNTRVVDPNTLGILDWCGILVIFIWTGIVVFLVLGFVTGIFLFVCGILLIFAGLGKGLLNEVAPFFYVIVYIPNIVIFIYLWTRWMLGLRLGTIRLVLVEMPQSKTPLASPDVSAQNY